MLKHLSIKNYAIIDELTIDFEPHLNIITGETGAGKSIILGALNMILGKRADTSVLRDSSIKAIIEGSFEIDHLELIPLFEKLDLEYESETIIRREIRPNGKSRAFVNDSPVTLDQLKTLVHQLVDLHSQQDNSSILDKRFYLSILDKLADQTTAVHTFKQSYRKFKAKEKQLHEARFNLINQRSDMDYLEFQFTELQELDLGQLGDDSIEEELAVLENAGQIIEQLQSTRMILSDGEISVDQLLRDAAEHISKLSVINEDLGELHTRMQQAQLEISDIANGARSLAENTEIDEVRLLELRERQNSLNRLLQKHRLDDIGALIDLRKTLEQRLSGLKVSDEDLDVLEKEVNDLRLELVRAAAEISKKRIQRVKAVEDEMVRILKEVGMPHAGVELRHQLTDTTSMHEMGMDEFELWFSANKGVDPEPLKQVASGGERSRLMLAVKSLIAQHMNLSTMIFDEIDTGISGEVASRVGDIFKRMSGQYQIIAITHLPQIAAQANRHLFVYKDNSRDVTVAKIKVLDKGDKVKEIAKMLSGDQPGKAALLTAKELIAVSLN